MTEGAVEGDGGTLPRMMIKGTIMCTVFNAH